MDILEFAEKRLHEELEQPEPDMQIVNYWRGYIDGVRRVKHEGTHR